jgi:hypothetical protein
MLIYEPACQRAFLFLLRLACHTFVLFARHDMTWFDGQRLFWRGVV